MNGKDMCHIHKTISMKLFSLGSCKCDPSKVKKQKFHDNTFMHIVNAQEIIQGCTDILGTKKGKILSSFDDLERISGCLVDLSKRIMEREDDICINSSSC